MNGWYLPENVQIGDIKYTIHCDYRDMLDIIGRLGDEEELEQVRVYVALALFYEDFESMPQEDYPEAVRELFSFLSCGEEESGQTRPKTIDWEQDRNLIVADVNKVSGCEIRALPFCHWWTFIGWFRSIGEGQLSTVVSIREKRRKGKKLEDWEKEFYRENREKVDFKTQYSDADEAILSRWT